MCLCVCVCMCVWMCKTLHYAIRSQVLSLSPPTTSVAHVLHWVNSSFSSVIGVCSGISNTYSRILHIHTYTHANVHTQEEQDGCAWGMFFMTPSYLVHDSFSYVVHDSFFLMWDKSHSFKWVSFRYATRLVHEFGNHNLYLRHDAFMCVTWDWYTGITFISGTWLILVPGFESRVFISMIWILEIAAYMSERAYTQSSWRPSNDNNR